MMTGRCVANSYRVEFPPGMKILSANDRVHYRTKAKLIKDIRTLAKELARDIPPLDQVHVTGIFYAENNRRRDCSNSLFYPVKSGLDGIVDAGVLKDDSDKFVLSTTYIRGEGTVKGTQIVIVIEEAE